MDTDINQDKQKSIKETIQYAKDKHIEVILSNPCFEVWFLLHFCYSSKAFSSNDQLLKALKKYIPEYRKSSDVYSMLAANTGNAISNAKKLEEYHINANHRLNTMECNPSTAVYKIVSLLRNE